MTLGISRARLFARRLHAVVGQLTLIRRELDRNFLLNATCPGFDTKLTGLAAFGQGQVEVGGAGIVLRGAGRKGWSMRWRPENFENELDARQDLSDDIRLRPRLDDRNHFELGTAFAKEWIGFVNLLN